MLFSVPTERLSLDLRRPPCNEPPPRIERRALPPAVAWVNAEPTHANRVALYAVVTPSEVLNATSA